MSTTPVVEYRVWTDLSDQERGIAVRLTNDGVDVEAVAGLFRLRSSSLSRKIRGIRSQAQVEGARKTVSLVAEKEKRVMVYSDTHFPVADPHALQCAIDIKRMFNPDVIINLGDTLDMYYLSRFAKSAGKRETIQGEANSWKAWASEFYDGFDGESYIVRGNHDARLERTMAGVSGLGDMDALSLDSVLDVSKFGCDRVVDLIIVNPRGDTLYPDGDMYFYHGDSVRSGSGQSARSLSGKLSNASVMMGHAHRTAVVVSRSSRGPSKSYEVGCLSSLDVDWNLYPDWSQSVMVGVVSNEYCDFSPIVIDRGRYAYNGAVRYCDAWKPR
jgi:predicted phosphodiesterase